MAKHQSLRHELVIDADSKNPSMRATSAGTEPYPFSVVNLAAAGLNLGREIKRMAENHDLIVVDCPPSVHDKNTEVAIAASDFVLESEALGMQLCGRARATAPLFEPAVQGRSTACDARIGVPAGQVGRSSTVPSGH